MGLQCALYLKTETDERLVFDGGTSTCCKNLADALKVNAYGEQDLYDLVNDELGCPDLKDINWTKLADCITSQLTNGKEEFDMIVSAVNSGAATLKYYSTH